jgi:hypothetical protein
MRRQESDHIRFEPGTYYIGDPCYAIPDEEWMDYLNTYPKSDIPGQGWVDGVAIMYKGHKCFHDSTAYGDGGYRGSDGIEYGVDAGIIGILPIEVCDPEAIKDIKANGLANVRTFDKPFHVWCEENGTFHFGDITIVTDGGDEDDDERCDSCGSHGETYCGLCEDCRDERDAEDDDDEDELLDDEDED